MLPTHSFSPQTVALMCQACDAAWREVREHFFFPSQREADAFRRDLTERVIAAVAAGEKDAARLKAIALEALED
jgi:hypothetical protein